MDDNNQSIEALFQIFFKIEDVADLLHRFINKRMLDKKTEVVLDIIVIENTFTYLISNSFLKQGIMIIPSDLIKL